MPIAFRVVSEEQYEAWLADAKKKYASADRRHAIRRGRRRRGIKPHRSV